PTRAATTAMAHFNLGVGYAREAKESPDAAELLRRAESELRAAVEQDHEHPQMMVELAKVLARQGRDREAIVAYEVAAGMDRSDWRIRHALGILHRRAGDAAA